MQFIWKSQNSNSGTEMVWEESQGNIMYIHSGFQPILKCTGGHSYLTRLAKVWNNLIEVYIKRPVSRMHTSWSVVPSSQLFNVFLFFFLIFIFNCKVLTYNTYLQTVYDTYATDRTILYLKKNKHLFTMWDTNNIILYLQYKTCNTYLQWDIIIQLGYNRTIY